MGDDFFARLGETTRFRDVVNPASHSAAPADWWVVITDVRGSTRAIEAGRYRDVNALGVASILGVKNALSGLEIPYVFGGDGATLLVPGSHLAEVDVALRGLRSLAQEAFHLELRVARVPVEALRNEGADVGVGRLRLSPHIALASFAGSGFALAEEWIKSEEIGPDYAVPQVGLAAVDLDGFECRWEPVPSERGVCAAILVVARGDSPEARTAVYEHVLDDFEGITGPVSSPSTHRG